MLKAPPTLFLFKSYLAEYKSPSISQDYNTESLTHSENLFCLEEEVKSGGKAASGNTLDLIPLRFLSTYKSHSVFNEFSIQKDICQPSSTFTETCMAEENMLEILTILSSVELCVPSENT